MSFIYGNPTALSLGAVITLTGNSGGAISPTLGNINVVGAGGVTVAGAGSTLTISVSGTGMTWSKVAGPAVNMVVNNAYIPNNVGLVTFTLPAVAAIGDILQIAGCTSGLWSIAQNAGQTIHFGALDTTTGVGGSLSAIAQYDSVEMVCVTANTDFTVISAVGNLTVV